LLLDWQLLLALPRYHEFITLLLQLLIIYFRLKLPHSLLLQELCLIIFEILRLGTNTFLKWLSLKFKLCSFIILLCRVVTTIA